MFSITNLNQLNSSSQIRLTFPSQRYWINDISASNLPITQGSMACSALLNVQTNIMCSGNYSAFSVQASSLFTSVINSGTFFSFQINTFLSPPTL